MNKFIKAATVVLGTCFFLPFTSCGDRGGFDINETPEDVKSITVFKNDWASFNSARPSNSPVYAEVKKKVGFDIVAESGSGETWMTQLQLRQADGDLPEIFLTEGPQSPEFFESLITEGDIIAISDYINEDTKNDYPNLYEHMQQFDYMKKNISYSDGKTWFIPTKWENEKSLYVRQDWIDNLNGKLASILVADGVISSESEMTDDLYEQWKFTVPKDLLEFYRLARAFTLYDPDNNGQKDTTGYFSEENKDMDCWVYVAYGTGWNEWVYDEDEGCYIPAELTDESMYATAFINKLMADGYMSQESITADNGTKQDRFMQGKVGMIYAQNWLNTFVSGLMDVYNCSLEEATDMIAMVEPPAGRDGCYGGAGQNGYWQGYCINARMSEARIEKCLKLFDYLYSDEGMELILYGVEGVHYTEDADGNKTTLLEANDKGFYTNIQSFDQATQLYGLVNWTGHYGVETITNGDICAEAMEKSAANRHKEDYPDLQTEATINYREGAYDYFWTTISNIENDSNGLFAADWTYDAKTFGWDQLYTVSSNLQGKWRTFVKEYKEDYYGQDMIDEYNEYIASGKAQKVNNVS